MKLHRFLFCGWFAGIAMALGLAVSARAVVHTLDDEASPIRATFDSATGRLTATVKATGTVWQQGTAGGGDAFSGGSLQSVTATKVVWQDVTIGAASPVTVTVELLSPFTTGELRVTLGNASTAIPAGLAYPYAFFTPTGAGYAICPINSGYVVPTSDLAMPGKFSPLASRRMEFCGGTDAANNEAWSGVIATSDDMNLTMATSTVGGASFAGTGVKWQGSNSNPARTPNLLSYDRVVRFRFHATGGYVAVAKQFRAFAESRGWVKTLAEKAAENPAVLDVIGAPVIYLWGDGHDTAFLDQLQSAGISRALLQLSVNHGDQFNTFPNQQFANASGWFNAVRAHSYHGGFYDIYQSARTAGAGGYSGFSYLWPADALNGNWAYVNSSGQPVQSAGAYDICATEQELFARTIRLPAQLGRFDMDATLFDTLCARPPSECYDTTHGHFETRTDDIASRAGILAAAYANPTKRLLSGTEQARSWAVPNLIWAEGVQHLGTIDSQGVIGTSVLGAFNGNAYPDITTDVKTLTAAQLASLLSDGYQVPLWDLVYHDCVLSTLHWERAQNKFVYGWDHADLAAMIRGQTALLSLVYQAAQGSVGDSLPAIVTDADGNRWSTRWLDSGDSTNFVRNRVLQTYNTVCAWHREVGLLEMTTHRWLTADRSVQLAEFSPDGGASGQGIVVNFGNFDGDRRVTGSTWTGSPRAGVTVAVPVNGQQTYTWGDSRASAPAFNPAAGSYSGNQTVSIISATPGTTIRYTTDGSAPSQTNGIAYSNPVTIGMTATLKAIAYRSGLKDSAVSQATYTLGSTPAPPPPAPTPSPTLPPPTSKGGGGGGAPSASFSIVVGLLVLLRHCVRPGPAIRP
jgi:hypothetical protein